MKHGKILALASMALLMLGCKAEAPSANEVTLPVTLQAPLENTAPTLATTLSSASTELSDIQLVDIVKNVMNDQYGNTFNEKYQCWNYSITNPDGDDTQYCMKPNAAKFIGNRAGKYIYFRAANRADISDDPAYSYSAVDSGLAGAFKLAIDESGDWKYVAASKAMDFGSMGYCGCDKAEFVRLGAGDYYGWMFSSGGTWQGVTVLNHVIIVPQDGVFKNISSIPEIREDEQDANYQLKIIDTDASKKIYPLLVSKHKKNDPVKELLVTFDENNKIYSIPDNF